MRWKYPRPEATVSRMAGIPRRNGETVTRRKASYPEIPMCQRGKYHISSARDVSMDQKMKAVLSGERTISPQCRYKEHADSINDLLTQVNVSDEPTRFLNEARNPYLVAHARRLT